MTCPPCTHDCEQGKTCSAKNKEPNTIVFYNANVDWVMRITADRRIEVNEGVEVTEAAQKVLDAMQQLLTKGLDKAIADEREACAKVAEQFEPDEKTSYVTYASTAIRARGQA
jgi:hypothetical protein